MFTALQRRGVQSRLLWFPDEGHWVLKPQNSKLWHDTVLDWIDAIRRARRSLHLDRPLPRRHFAARRFLGAAHLGARVGGWPSSREIFSRSEISLSLACARSRLRWAEARPPSRE